MQVFRELRFLGSECGKKLVLRKMVLRNVLSNVKTYFLCVNVVRIEKKDKRIF